MIEGGHRWTDPNGDTHTVTLLMYLDVPYVLFPKDAGYDEYRWAVDEHHNILSVYPEVVGRMMWCTMANMYDDPVAVPSVLGSIYD